jgi:uncharacterized protein
MLLIIQGTPFCNINCSYCYLPDRDRRDRLSIDTLRCIVSRLCEFVQTARAELRELALRPAPDAAREIAVVWHAGEPLVLPISFYQAAFAAFEPLRSLGLRVSHGFQTNGTLINDSWVRFFAEARPNIGVSIDGPQEIHDLHRKYRNGTGSFQNSLAGITRLQAAGIPFHTISVLTEPALRLPDRMFEFFLERDLLDIGFNIEEIDGINKDSSLAQKDIVDLYAGFLRHFLHRNVDAGFPLRLREAEHVAALLLKGELPSNSQTQAGQIVSVDVSGNVSTFSPELLGLRNEQFADFIIGNVFESSLAEMLEGAVALSLGQEISRGVANCRATCDVFSFCKGGAPANKYCETGSFQASETMHCALTVKATLRECIEVIYQSLAHQQSPAGQNSNTGIHPWAR